MIRLAPSARPFPHMPTHSSTDRSLLLRAALLALVLLGVSASVSASTGSGDVAQRVVDVPTRPGVSQRFLFLSPREPRATVVLFAGDHGGLQIAADGRFQYGNLAVNFLVRSRKLFVEHDLAVAIVDAPSDRQGFPFRNLSGSSDARACRRHQGGHRLATRARRGARVADRYESRHRVGRVCRDATQGTRRAGRDRAHVDDSC